jgi:ABC-type lipopolysaccharide export system ATPase subunit
MIDRVEKELSELQIKIVVTDKNGSEWVRINNRIFFLKGWLACHRGEAI